MKRTNRLRRIGSLTATCWLLAAVSASGGTPAGPGFTYQAQIKKNGSAVNETCDCRFALWDHPSSGNQLGAAQTLAAQPVVNGLFTVTLNSGGEFGPNAFNGEARWLEISVACPSGGALTLLSPRQAVTPSPYALHAINGPDGHSLNAVDGDPVDAVFVDGSGNVGIGTTSPNARMDVNGAALVTTLQITGGESLATATGTLFGWGLNSDGQINVPVGAFTRIAAGGRHSLAIRGDGTLVGWGRNVDGEINVPAGTFIAIAAGGAHSLAIRSNGTLVGWGANGSGQTTVPAGTFIAVAAGSLHSVAVRSDGTLVGWGNNTSGQINVPAGTFTAVEAGNSHCLGLRTDGTLAAWGSNTSGQTNVPAGTFKAIAGGALHNLAIRTDGTLAGWGSNASGQATVPAGTYLAISAGGAHSLGIRTDGTLAGWGFNPDGQTNVPAGTFFTHVAAGSSHSLAIKVDPATFNFGLLLAQDSAAKPGTNTWTIFSDRRLKKNIGPLTGALEKLLSLQGVRFEWNNAATAGGHRGRQMGLIADQVQKVFPEWVGSDARGYRTLTIGGFEALTAEALRELRAEKDAQLGQRDAEISKLQATVSRKDSEIADLQVRVQRMEMLLGQLAAPGE